jgi:16S rRNA (cytidine1402-2'-O)-methyltransferase
MKGALFLIPSDLGETAPAGGLASQNMEITSRLRYFIVEDLRTARRFLKKHLPGTVIDELSFGILNEHTPESDWLPLLQPLEAGTDGGLISEAGMPCLADPGSGLVSLAHERGIQVRPLPGPSSIFLALAASGLNGQQFAFSGYLPVDKHQRAGRIRELEAAAVQKGITQIFIETPYRNLQMFEALCATLHPGTRLCIAANLTLPGEWVASRTIAAWKKAKVPDINKKPAVFLIG